MTIFLISQVFPFKCRLKEERIIVAIQGAERNVIVITPPLCFTVENARRTIEAFGKALANMDITNEEPTSILGYLSFYKMLF